MKQFFITSAFVFISLITFAQDQKWSVEANYPLREGADGIIDLGIKYRFLDLGPVQIGAGFNSSFFKNIDRFTFNGDQEFIFKNRSVLLQPKVFGEMSIPGVSRLRSHVGLGYAVYLNDLYQKQAGTVNFDETQSDGGFNANFGLSYDISKRLFVQLQYDYVRLNRKGINTFNGQSIPYDFKENVSLIKLGIGFRF